MVAVHAAPGYGAFSLVIVSFPLRHGTEVCDEMGAVHRRIMLITGRQQAPWCCCSEMPRLMSPNRQGGCREIERWLQLNTAQLRLIELIESETRQASNSSGTKGDWEKKWVNTSWVRKPHSHISTWSRTSWQVDADERMGCKLASSALPPFDGIGWSIHTVDRISIDSENKGVCWQFCFQY